MTTYLGRLGAMIPFHYLLAAVESRRPSLQMQSDIYGTPDPVIVGDRKRWRIWELETDMQWADEVTHLAALVESSPGPYRLVTHEAANMNILTPQSSVNFDGWGTDGGGRLELSGPIAARWSYGYAWTQNADGSWSTDAPSTTNADGSISFGSDVVDPVPGGEMYVTKGVETERGYLSQHAYTLPEDIYRSPYYPVLPGQPVTQSIYVNGGEMVMQLFDVEGNVVSTQTATAATNLGGSEVQRLTVSITAPDTAVKGRYRVTGASRMGAAAVTWTPVASAWVMGLGANAVMLGDTTHETRYRRHYQRGTDRLTLTATEVPE